MCPSAHKAIVVITGRAHCFHDFIHITLILLSVRYIYICIYMYIYINLCVYRYFCYVPLFLENSSIFPHYFFTDVFGITWTITYSKKLHSLKDLCLVILDYFGGLFWWCYSSY